MVRGFCPLDCPDTCSWQIEVDDTGRAVSLRADRDHPFTAGALCGKVNRYLDAVYSPDRLLHPLRRVGRKGEGRFEQITWEEALRLTAEGLQDAIERHGPESILPYYYAGTMGYIQGWTLGPRLFRHLGASQLHTNLCPAAAHAACDATLGAAVGYDPEDVVDAKLVILWGEPPQRERAHVEVRARGPCSRGPPRRRRSDPSESAARCDEHIAPLPGTDAALALGLMRTVLDEGAADIDWLERHTVGWPELEARLAEWPVERAAEVCGLDVGVVRALGRRLAHTRPTAIRLGLGMQRHGGAGAAIRAVLAIPAVTGDWRHVGGGALSLTSDHFPFPVASVVSPPDLPAPPARTVNMSRLGEALTETTTRRSRRWWSSTRTRPRATRIRCACGAALRATTSSPSCSSSASPTRRTSPTSSCPSRCSRSTTTSTAPTVICTSNGTSRLSSPRASAVPTRTSFGRSRSQWASGIPG